MQVIVTAAQEVSFYMGPFETDIRNRTIRAAPRILPLPPPPRHTSILPFPPLCPVRP